MRYIFRGKYSGAQRASCLILVTLMHASLCIGAGTAVLCADYSANYAFLEALAQFLENMRPLAMYSGSLKQKKLAFMYRNINSLSLSLNYVCGR